MGFSVYGLFGIGAFGYTGFSVVTPVFVDSFPPLKNAIVSFNDTRQWPETSRGKSGPGVVPVSRTNSVDFVLALLWPSTHPPVSHKVLLFFMTTMAASYLGWESTVFPVTPF
jgi:hypothetical protein